MKRRFTRWVRTHFYVALIVSGAWAISVLIVVSLFNASLHVIERSLEATNAKMQRHIENTNELLHNSQKDIADVR